MPLPHVSHARGSGWFPVAVQALVYLARTDAACSSSAMAPDLNAHAVFLRRVLAQLGRANLIQAREGRAGGYQLARSPEQITLAEVYRAVSAAEPTDHTDCPSALPTPGPTPVESVLGELEAEAERRRLEVLTGVTLADVIQRVTSADRLP